MYCTGSYFSIGVAAFSQKQHSSGSPASFLPQPTHFWLVPVPQAEDAAEGMVTDNIVETGAELQAVLNIIPKPKFQSCFWQGEMHWVQCINSNADNCE